MDKETLSRIRAIYPYATSYEVIGRDAWVRCTFQVGCVAVFRLGTSPTTAAIAAEILEAAK